MRMHSAHKYRVSKHMFRAHFRRWTVWGVYVCNVPSHGTPFTWLLLFLSRNYECILPNRVFCRLCEIMRAIGREHRAMSSCKSQCKRCIAENWQILMNKRTLHKWGTARKRDWESERGREWASGFFMVLCTKSFRWVQRESCRISLVTFAILWLPIVFMCASLFARRPSSAAWT